MKIRYHGIREAVPKELKDYFSNYTDYELELFLELGLLKIRGANNNVNKYDNVFGAVWDQYYNKPLVGIETLPILFNHIKELENKAPLAATIKSFPAYSVTGCLLFIYESVEAGKIKSLSKEIRGGDELRNIYYKYQMYLSARGNMPFSKAYDDPEYKILHAKFVELTDNVYCNINPEKTINYLYSTKIGKTFLPASLIKYLDNKQKANTPNISDAIPMPYIPTPSQKQHNRSGSKINQSKHERTRQACQSAWGKIQKNARSPNLNFNNFSEMASSFLGQGESLNTTVSRAFYKEEVTQMYKAGVGRKAK